MNFYFDLCIHAQTTSRASRDSHHIFLAHTDQRLIVAPYDHRAHQSFLGRPAMAPPKDRDEASERMPGRTPRTDIPSDGVRDLRPVRRKEKKKKKPQTCISDCVGGVDLAPEAKA